MSKKPRLSPTIRNYIALEALRQKHKPRNVLALEIKQKIDESGMGRSPAEETIIRLISNVRAHAKSPLDEPWSVITLELFPFSPEALPFVLTAWIYYQEQMIDREYLNEAFSIRMAKWAARLCRVVENSERLASAAYAYSLFERSAEALGEALPSFLLDLRIYQQMTGEEIIENDERYAKVTRGLNIPEKFAQSIYDWFYYSSIDLLLE